MTSTSPASTLRSPSNKRSSRPAPGAGAEAPSGVVDMFCPFNVGSRRAGREKALIEQLGKDQAETHGQEDQSRGGPIRQDDRDHSVRGFRAEHGELDQPSRHPEEEDARDERDHGGKGHGGERQS